MLFCVHQWALFVALVMYVSLPRSSSRSVLSSIQALDAFTDPDFIPSVDTSPSVSKRGAAADPWNICPRVMRRIDCFYEYLSIYATLRDEMEHNNPRSYRNIGKRSGGHDLLDNPSSFNNDVICPTDMSPLDCLLMLDLLEKR